DRHRLSVGRRPRMRTRLARRSRVPQPAVRAARPSRRGGAGGRSSGLRRACRATRDAEPHRSALSRSGARSMTTTAEQAPAPARARPRPLWWRLLMWALIVVVIGAAAELLGWDIRGWFHSLWQTMTTISVGSLIAAVACMIIQTSATAYAWYSILHFAYPERT